MLNIYKKRKILRILYSPITIVLFVIVVFLLSTSVWNVYTKERETSLKRDKSESDMNSLKERAEALKMEIDRLSTERGLEEEVRSKFEVVKEGESVIVVVDPKDGDEVEKIEDDVSWWSRIFNWF